MLTRIEPVRYRPVNPNFSSLALQIGFFVSHKNHFYAALAVGGRVAFVFLESHRAAIPLAAKSVSLAGGEVLACKASSRASFRPR